MAYHQLPPYGPLCGRVRVVILGWERITARNGDDVFAAHALVKAWMGSRVAGRVNGIKGRIGAFGECGAVFVENVGHESVGLGEGIEMLQFS